ncbi:MAG: PRC-barrel domain-containing protein [Terracoccus sp.]
MTSNDDSTLYTLGDRGQTVDGSANDVRGLEVKDSDGASMGTVADLLIDGRESKVRFLLVEHGGLLGFGKTKTLIPVDAVTQVTEDAVLINLSRDRVASAPGYAPHLVNDREHHSSIYSHFGYEPYWAPGYRYPVGLGVGLGILPMSHP